MGHRQVQGDRGSRRGGPHSSLWVYETPDSEAVSSEEGGDLWPSPGKGTLELSDLDRAT